MAARASLCVGPALLASLTLLAGCLTGGGITLVAISPTAAQSLDAGQTLTITASLVNGSSATFSLHGPGSLSTPTLIPSNSGQSSFLSVVYTAPSPITAATQATVTATSTSTPSASASVVVNLAPGLSITTASLPAGTASTPYTTTLTASGGSGTLKWGLASGTLPAGLSLNATTGVIAGTPTNYGNFPITIAVTDSATVPVTATQSYTLVIQPQPPTITPSALPNGTAGSTYNQQLTYTGGGAGAPTYTLTGGALPTGITLSAGGLLSGNPATSTAGNTYTFSVTVTVGAQTSAPVQFSITVYPLPVVTTTSLPSGNVGIGYSRQLTYTGGNGGAVSWAIVGGSLPANSGLTLSASGLLSGKPTTAPTTYSFSVAVTVGPQTSAPQALTLTINSLLITSGSTASGEAGLPFSFHLTAQGGTGPYTWSLANGSAPLPAPLTLNGTTGVIGGTPTTSVNSPFSGIVVQATDSLHATATQAMTFTINPAPSTANNALLTGNYVFLLSGFDATGKPLVTGGVFTVNGAGAVTGGAVDANGTALAAATLNTAIQSGAYSVGADYRGRLKLTTASATAIYTLALNSAATGGYLTEFDASGNALTGIFGQQTSTAPLSGGFAFGAGGFAANSTAAALTHRALAGEFQVTGIGGFFNAEYLSSSSISATPTVPTGGAITIGALGRGTLSFTKSSGATVNFILYEVTPAQLYFLSSDPASGNTGTNDLVSGTALKQTIATGSYITSSLSGTAVVRSQSVQTPTTGAQYADAFVGLYTFTGGGAATLSADENAGGTVTTRSLSGSYTVAANGRVTATLGAGLGGCLNCIGPNQTFAYLAGVNQGYTMDFSTQAFSGFFEPQTATGITNGSFSGTYVTGSLSPLNASATLLSGALSANGNGGLTGTDDISAAGTLSPDTLLTATYVAAPSGRTTLTPSAGDNSALYIVSTTKAIGLDLVTAYPVIDELQH